MNRKNLTLLTLLLSATFSTANAASDNIYEPASKHTRAYNDSLKAIAAALGNDDIENSKRGFIATFTDANNPIVDGKPLFDLHAQNFLDKDAPATANPLLWRHSQLYTDRGLFEVVPGIYQVRNFEIANITFVKTNTGYVVIDASSSNEVAKASIDLFYEHVGKAPIRALIITHPHGDHFGGVKGLLDNIANKGDQIPIIAPKEFFKHAVEENVLAGVPMARRAGYMFGAWLPKDDKGLLSSWGLQSTITRSLLPATQEINDDVQTLTLDGVDFTFHLALETEAPSEIAIYIPKYKAFQQADQINHTMHNLLTPRGAKIRNGLVWSKYIDSIIASYGHDVEVSLGSHQWPVWGNGKVVEFWEKQRDEFRYIHDQTLFYANKGLTPTEISNEIKLNKSLGSYSGTREYYGNIAFNARSQYELYFGNFDGNPANLEPLSVSDESARLVEAIGGADKVIALAQKAYDGGDYRWAANLLNKVVFANPKNAKARKLLAGTYTQLAYQAESSPFRNFYLTGAKELLQGAPKASARYSSSSFAALSPSLFFDVVATRIDGFKHDHLSLTANVELTDVGQTIGLIYKNGALSNRPGSAINGALVTVKGTKADIYALFSGLQPYASAASRVSVSGDASVLRSFISSIEQPDASFNIIEP